MNAQDLLQCILLGGVLGMVGQGIRTIVGIKKENDSVNEKARTSGLESVSYYESLSGKRLVISLSIGFVAGVLAYLFLTPDEDSDFAIKITKANVLAIIASGYAGVDFIEGFMNRYLPDTKSTYKAASMSSEVQAAYTKLPPVPTK